MSTLADTIRRLDGEATEAPWRLSEFGDNYRTLYRTFDAGNLTLGEDVVAEMLSARDAELVAALRNNAPAITDALGGTSRVRELHRPAAFDDAPGVLYCAHCQSTGDPFAPTGRTYPCPTIRALIGSE